MIESSGADQEAVGGPFDDLGNDGVPGLAASGPDGDGEADEIPRQSLEIRPRIEASPGAIGEATGPPALKGCRRRLRGAVVAGGGSGREAEQCPVLVAIEDLVELVEQLGRGHLLFHEATEDDKAAGAELAFGGGEA